MKPWDKPKIPIINIGKFIRTNRYGFFTNLKNPIIFAEYERRKEALGKTLIIDGLSDSERHEFDLDMADKYRAEYENYKAMIGWEAEYERTTAIPSPERLEDSEAYPA